MGTASFSQNSFLGGEWSPQMQGRFDRPDYRSALNLCLNVIPIEEGAAPRRSGTRLGGVTRSGAYAVLREYHVDQRQPYLVELTAGHLRLWQAGANLVTHPGTNVSGISSADPAVFTSIAHGLATGDQVIFTLESASSYAGISQIIGRQLAVTVLSSSTFTVVDALTGATIDGTTITFADLVDLTVFKIFDLATDYIEDDLQQVRIVQDGTDALFLHNSYQPQTLVISEDSNGVFTDATFDDAMFYDGPYLDIPMDGSTLTPDALTAPNFTASDIASINDGHGFLHSDIGRMIRVFSEPLEWNVLTAYSTGDKVKEAGVYWEAVAGSTGKKPSTDAGVKWVIDTTAAKWTWGTIDGVVSATEIATTLTDEVSYPDNIAGGGLLYTNAITAWQLGAYCEFEGYPACGAYYQGRIWLGGAIKNRFDACVSNDFAVNGRINFAPTGKDGTVADNNGIAGTLNSSEIENFLWMVPDEQGVLAGTQGGEWVISSSALGEPITPTSILTREPTRYGSLNAQAIKVGRATIFAHRDTRKVYEYMANYFTQKFVADNLSLKAKHLTKGKVAELAFMRELTPIIWVRLEDGGLIGCTYKHDDPIQPLEFAAWHQHALGTGRDVISIQSGPANGGETDTLSMVTQDPDTGFCYVEFLQTIWQDGDSLLTAWYVDGGINVAAAARIDATTVRLYGLWYMVGEEVTVWGAGLDLGDFTVGADGTIDLPLNDAESLFTDALLAETTALGCTSLSTEIIGTDNDTATVFIMSAEENYDANRVSFLDALTSYHNTDLSVTSCLTDQNYQGVQWDAVRRNLMYMYTERISSTPLTNTTGHKLWDGITVINTGAAVDPSQQFNTSVGIKNIDSGEVNFYINYNVANLVPAGIGGGDGTWRRYTNEFPANGAPNQDGPGMTDPYTGNFWVNSSSCPLYCFRLEDNYSQIISPFAPVLNSNNLVQIVGFTNTGVTSPWAFAREVASAASHAYLYLIPRLITAAETAADYLLAYATYQYPTWTTSNQKHFHAYNREVFDHAGYMYLFSCTPSGGKNFKLYKFTPPGSANYPAPAVGGGFTDITPWGASTGPNADASGYTLLRPSGITVETSPIIPLYLPATDDLVLIEKFFPIEHTANSYDPALMKWSCTYVHDPSGSPAWDHHSSFVTGYMTADWQSTDISNAAFAVQDAFEVNSYLGQSDYDYSGIENLDYTKRWFFFVCTKMVNGVSNNKPRIVLVEYQFVYGSAPSVVQVIDEQGWDDRYPDYAPLSSDAYAPYDNVDVPAVAVSMATAYAPSQYWPLWDVGIHDPVTNVFWWSGGGSNLDADISLFGQFNPKFKNRMRNDAYEAGRGVIPGATPPFMKLSFGLTYCAPFAVGHTYCSRGQILRPVTPNESMSQTGPSLGKYRRATDAMVLLADTQGMSMGVDFLTMRPLAFKTNNGIGQAGGGVTAMPLNQTFSGVYKGNVDADSNFDNMWCWEVCRPYPCTVIAVELQHKANENT